MSIVTKKRTLSQEKNPENWQKQLDVFSTNDVIEAFLDGKEAGRNEHELAIRKLFNSNLETAKYVSEKVILKAKSLGINLYTVYLKADQVTHFYALVIAQKEDYTSDAFLETIRAARAYKNEADKEDFTINFTYTYFDTTLNESCLGHEGYFLRYGQQ